MVGFAAYDLEALASLAAQLAREPSGHKYKPFEIAKDAIELHRLGVLLRQSKPCEKMPARDRALAVAQRYGAAVELIETASKRRTHSTLFLRLSGQRYTSGAGSLFPVA